VERTSLRAEVASGEAERLSRRTVSPAIVKKGRYSTDEMNS
jgi:hypothetical protein